MLAIRVAGAGNKAAARAGFFDHKILAALRAYAHYFVLGLFLRNGFYRAVFPPLKIAGVAAFGIAGTGQKGPGLAKLDEQILAAFQSEPLTRAISLR